MADSSDVGGIHRVATQPAHQRARYFIPEVAFKRPIPPVPGKVFSDERARAFDPAAPTGFVPLDQGEALNLAWPATTPALLARYIVLRPGESLRHNFASAGEVFYVLRGAGETRCAGETLTWSRNDGFVLPGGVEVEHASRDGAILWQVTDEPMLAYLNVRPAPPQIAPTLYPADDVQAHLDAIHHRTGEQTSAGKSVGYMTEAMGERRIATPTMITAVNSLEPGGDQRPHRHSSVALTLVLQGEGVYSVLEGEKIDWLPDTVFCTPPGAVHSHHNRGPEMMLSFVVQDTGLHSQLRTTNFAFAD